MGNLTATNDDDGEMSLSLDCSVETIWADWKTQVRMFFVDLRYKGYPIFYFNSIKYKN